MSNAARIGLRAALKISVPKTTPGMGYAGVGSGLGVWLYTTALSSIPASASSRKTRVGEQLKSKP
jgi:hypothetical protein